MNNLGYLLAAYFLVWAFLFAYTWWLMNRHARLRKELDKIKACVKK